MSFKKMETNFSFADVSLFSSLEHNRAIKRMEQIDAIVDWSRIENLLIRNYPVGKSAEGNEAYPPLILMKCLLLQQWFHIDSDPELETQINDLISFKKFLGLSFETSPQRLPRHLSMTAHFFLFALPAAVIPIILSRKCMQTKGILGETTETSST